MQRGQALGERQAKTCALLFARCARIQLLEFRKKTTKVRFGDSNAIVRDRDLEHLVKALSSDRNASAFRRELDGVGDEIQEHLLQLARVGIQLPTPRDVCTDPDLLLGRDGLDRVRDLSHHL